MSLSSTTDLGVAERLPEWTAVQRKGEERQHSRADRDHDRAEAHDSRVDQRLFEGLAFFVHFLDEIKEDDHMAHDDADQACHAQKCHEAERHAHHRQAISAPTTP